MSFEETAYQAHETGGEALEKEILQERGPFLLNFTASWCPPCRALEPVLDRIAREMGRNLKVLVVDADENPALVKRFDVEGVPTSLLVVEGRVKDRIVGVQTFDAFRERLKGLLE